MQLSLVGYEDAGASEERGYSQENMQSFGFSTRHGQQVEAGRPITVTTLFRICEVFEVPMSKLVQGAGQRWCVRETGAGAPHSTPQTFVN